MLSGNQTWQCKISHLYIYIWYSLIFLYSMCGKFCYIGLPKGFLRFLTVDGRRSCTSWWLFYPTICRVSCSIPWFIGFQHVSTIQAGAGFLPSTVSLQGCTTEASGDSWCRLDIQAPGGRQAWEIIRRIHVALVWSNFWTRNWYLCSQTLYRYICWNIHKCVSWFD